jgi:hypothetical protein
MKNCISRALACVFVCGAVQVAAQKTPDSTHLICLGAGSANKVASAYAFGSNGQWATVLSKQESPFDDQVNVDINWENPDQSRIRLPRKMLPGLHGGKEGWFELREIDRSEGEIRASAAINFANHPKVRIDRKTGAISINGKAGDYSGTCQPYDPATMQHKF